MYFWKRYSILRPDLYRNIVNHAIQGAQGTNQIPDKITLTPEMHNIFNTIDNSQSLVYACKLNSRQKRKSLKGVEIYCKKLEKVSKERRK